MTFPETRCPERTKPIPAAAAAQLGHDNLPIVLRVLGDVEHRLAVRAFNGFAPPWQA
jgi:hypothetical protein